MVETQSQEGCKSLNKSNLEHKKSANGSETMKFAGKASEFRSTAYGDRPNKNRTSCAHEKDRPGKMANLTKQGTRKENVPLPRKVAKQNAKNFSKKFSSGRLEPETLPETPVSKFSEISKIMKYASAPTDSAYNQYNQSNMFSNYQLRRRQIDSLESKNSNNLESILENCKGWPEILFLTVKIC